MVSLDRLDSHLGDAAQPKVVADAFQLPFRAASFDFVFSSFFLHHFTDDQIVELLGNFKRLARRAVLAIDLERGPLALRFLPATQWLFNWHSMFVHDGLISVQAALRPVSCWRWLAAPAWNARAFPRIAPGAVYRWWRRLACEPIFSGSRWRPVEYHGADR